MKVTQEQLDEALDAYRKAMMLRWIHPSQDAAARSLAMLYSAWRRQVDREKAATKGDGRPEEERWSFEEVCAAIDVCESGHAPPDDRVPCDFKSLLEHLKRNRAAKGTP